MQEIGRVHFRVDHNGIVKELILLQNRNGSINHIPLEKERNYLNAIKNRDVTKILTIEQIGDQFYTNYKTLPGRHSYTKKELKMITASMLKRLEGTGRQKIIILF